MDSNNKIKKLTDRIYNEGIEKAKAEADLIVSNAKREAEMIIAAAKDAKEKLIENAKKEVGELKKNSDAEIRMAALKFINNLKQQIARLITAELVEKPVREAFSDKGFVKEILLSIIKNWNPQKPDDMNISLLLPQKDERELNNYFAEKTTELLNAGLEIKFIPGITNGFKIGPGNNNYLISFTDSDFENYLKSYLKDKTWKKIFE